MLKISNNKSVMPEQALKREQKQETKLLENFLDRFDSKRTFTPAAIALEQGMRRTKKRKLVRDAPIEAMPKSDALRRTSLHNVALSGDKNWLALIASKASDEQLILCDIFGKTPLHYAAEKGILKELLVGREALLMLLQIPDANGDTPLHIMAKNSFFDSSCLDKIKHKDLSILFIKNSNNLSVLDVLKNSKNNVIYSDLLLRIKFSHAI